MRVSRSGRIASQDGLKLISPSMHCLSMVVHSGSRFLGEGSKIKALYIPPPMKEPCTEEPLAATADIVVNEDRFTSYTNEFKHLGILPETQSQGITPPG